MTVVPVRRPEGREVSCRGKGEASIRAKMDAPTSPDAPEARAVRREIIEVRYQAIRPGPETHASFPASIRLSPDPARHDVAAW